MLVNARLYTDWFSIRSELTRDIQTSGNALPLPDDEGFFSKGCIRCILPYLRVFWPEDSKPAAPQQFLSGWRPVETVQQTKKAQRRTVAGYLRYFTASEMLDWLEHEATEEGKLDTDVFFRLLRTALKACLVPLDETIALQAALLNTRVETVRVWRPGAPDKIGKSMKSQVLQWCPQNLSLDSTTATPSARLRWTRKADMFPEILRQPDEGVDPVHTPENHRAGLTRYLADGFRISKDGELVLNKEQVWGLANLNNPHRLQNAPRRLMLGATLQSRGVAVSADPGAPGDSFHVPSATLHTAFTFHLGFTHEDAVVVSEAAAQKLRRVDERRMVVRIPALASRIEWHVQEGTEVRAGQNLITASADLYGLGLRWNEVVAMEKLGHPIQDGWLSLEVDGAQSAYSGRITAMRERKLLSTRWKSEVHLSIRADSPLSVGDKVATAHGIKGVVSRILPELTGTGTGEPADILLNPVGLARRGAFGQFCEAVGGISIEEFPLPRGGQIRVMRQPQDAEPRCRFRGISSQSPAAHGQRYGGMEFLALMAHEATAIAAELLSLRRSTARWMQIEATLAPEFPAQQLAAAALNRYLSLLGARICDRCIQFDSSVRGSDGILAITVNHSPGVHIVKSKSADLACLKRSLEDEDWFRDKKGSVAIDLSANPVILELRTNEGRNTSVKVTLNCLPVLPPWLLPSQERLRNQITDRYYRLIKALERNRPTGHLCSEILNTALGDRFGVGAFLKREVLARRLTRSARAVIVPNPTLRIDEIGVPEDVIGGITGGLDDAHRRIVLVNRNPTLHRRGLIAMRVIPRRNSHVFEFPLAVLESLGADFDGDQASIVALESPEALQEAERLLPGFHDSSTLYPSLRVDRFRRQSPLAFRLIKELSDLANPPGFELAMALDTMSSQEDWAAKHKEELDTRLQSIGDGFSNPEFEIALQKQKEYLSALSREQYLQRVPNDMNKLFGTIRKKGQYGGILRSQLFRRTYTSTDPASFFKSVDALGTFTERLTQSALSSKSGAGIKRFPYNLYLRDPNGFLQNSQAEYDQAKAFAEESFQEKLKNLEMKSVAAGPREQERLLVRKMKLKVRHQQRTARLTAPLDLWKGLDELLEYNVLSEVLGKSTEPLGLLSWLAKPSLITLLSLAGQETVLSANGDPRVDWFLAGPCDPANSSMLDCPSF